MKKNSRKHNDDFASGERNQNNKEKKIQYNYSLLKTNQIPLVGKHSILSALNNKNRKLHYLITTNANYTKWKNVINKLKLIIISLIKM